MEIKPEYDYCLGRKIEKDTSAITGVDISDTHQKFEIISVGDGRLVDGVLHKPTVEAGDVVWIQKHAAEGDTPSELYDEGLALFQATRIMAKEIN